MKTKLCALACGLLALAFTSGCADPLEPGSRVSSFRVLAQRMDAPYARPGETVHVSSLAHDPEGRPLEWAWAACANPSSSDVFGCIDALGSNPLDGSSLLALGREVNAVDVTVPLDALSSLPEDARASASVGVLSVACPGTLSLGAGPGGLPFRCTEPGGGRELALDEFVVGVKRIGVRDVDRNRNPELARLTFDAREWPAGDVPSVEACGESEEDFDACADGLKHRVALEVTSDSYESGETEHGEAYSEQLVVQYFASEGIFEYDTRIAANPGTQWVARSQAKGRNVTFWFVARDNRGGVTWTTREVHVD